MSRLTALLRKMVRHALPTRIAATISFRRSLGYWPRLRNPRTYNEKILYRKLYDHDPRMPRLIDKVEVKEFVASRLGPEWIIPTFYAGPTLPPLGERNWPLPYVIKPNHRSGAVIFVRRPEEIDWPRIETECARWMAQPPYGQDLHEWGYRDIKPQILIEEFIGDNGVLPPDYRFYVFAGRAEFINIDIERETGRKRNFYDRSWKMQDVRNNVPMADKDIPVPPNLDRMIEAAEILGRDWSFVRVDLYEGRDHPKFGEMTFYPGSGMRRFRPPEWDFIFGRLWPLDRHKARQAPGAP